jgi:hypothetical protein
MLKILFCCQNSDKITPDEWKMFEALKKIGIEVAIKESVDNGTHNDPADFNVVMVSTSKENGYTISYPADKGVFLEGASSS